LYCCFYTTTTTTITPPHASIVITTINNNNTTLKKGIHSLGQSATEEAKRGNDKRDAGERMKI